MKFLIFLFVCLFTGSVGFADDVSISPDYATVRFRVTVDVEGETEQEAEHLAEKAAAALEPYRKLIRRHTEGNTILEEVPRAALSEKDGLIHEIRFPNSIGPKPLFGGNWVCSGTLEVGMVTKDLDFVDRLRSAARGEKQSRHLNITYSLSVETWEKMRGGELIKRERADRPSR